MRRVLWVIGLASMWACTKANPAANCINGACLDKDFPFCDTTGDVGGTPGACIEAPDCTPSTVVCKDATVTTCDNTGTVSNVEKCALGCDDPLAQCKTFVPANDIQQFVDMVASPVDLTFDNGVIDVDADTFTPDGGSAATLGSIDVPAPPGGSAFRVIVGKHIKLGTLSINHPEGPTASGVGRAVVFYASDGIEVTGRVEITVGAVDTPGCTSSIGGRTGATVGGSGGGGHATAGGAGGNVMGVVLAMGGAGGGPSGSDELVPLRGGCPARGFFGTSPQIESPGGGAIQLSSLTTISITGTIAADGRASIRGAGGGGGGGILIDAPDVSIAATAKLLTRGGPGMAGDGFNPVTVSDDAAPIDGEVCNNPTTICGNGGDGASAGIDAQNGVSSPTMGPSQYDAGGGGGGLGRIRVNTQSGDLQAPIGAVFAGAFTQGTITTK